MDANKLKRKLIEQRLNVAKTAELLGMNKITLYRKLNGFEKLTISDAIQLKNLLGLTDSEAITIFLES